MPGRRKVFGTRVAEKLLDLLGRWIELKYPFDDSQVLAAFAVLEQYSKVVKWQGLSSFNSLRLEMEVERQSHLMFVEGGAAQVSSSHLTQLARGDFSQVVLSRKSIRNYKDVPVDPALLEKAVSMATQSPSSCNRQSTHVFFTTEVNQILELLRLQGGSRGFSELVPALLLVTGDIGSFGGGGDRKQLGIDAGLFSMTLMYAIGYLGLSSCALNWAATPGKDRRLRKLKVIPDDHDLVMMMAVGYAPSDVAVALSHRTEVNRIFHRLNYEGWN